MELQHHGVEGQKWGVKNGPPYPLERTAKNARSYNRAIHKTNEQIARKKVAVSRNNKKIEKAKKKNDANTVKELAKIGKEELKSIRSLEIQRQKIVKNAKTGGFQIKEATYKYDGRTKNELVAKNTGLALSSMAGGLIGAGFYELGDYLVAKNMGYLVELPMYVVKVPKENSK